MKWKFLMFTGWSTLVASLFLASLFGEASAQLFDAPRYTQYFIQGLVMSGLVVPIILYLYKHVYRMIGIKPKVPVYSWKRLNHFITGILLASALASLGFIIASLQGWIVIADWHTPDQWFGALLINILFAIFMRLCQRNWDCEVCYMMSYVIDLPLGYQYYFKPYSLYLSL